MSLAYRPDIDGLRAVAVGSVVLFHAGFWPLRGGFVGVDVFFVISGFLITSVLLRDMEAGRFSLITFCDHRIRRIFPALVVVLVAVSAAAALVLSPRALRQFAESVPPSILFVANFHFEDVLDYFGPRAEEAPLLHLWSLALEEQFYILFPLALLAAVRLAGLRWSAALFAGIAAASLAYAVHALKTEPMAAFFLLPSRAWELLAGAVLALAPWRRPSPAVAEGLGWAGLLCILVPVFAYDRHTPFPGLAALPPVLGTAALIFAGGHHPQGFVTRLLSLRTPVYVGRISYSLYLWHWPLLVLAGAYLGRALGGWEAAGIVALSVALSALSLRFVEAPLRRPCALGGRRAVRLAAAGGVIVLLAGVAWGFESYGGRLWPVSPRAAAAEAAMADRAPFHRTCVNPPRKWNGTLAGTLESCSIGPDGAAGGYEVVVWGDSHADAVFPGIGAIVASLGHTARLTFMPGCPPLLGGSVHRAKVPAATCAAFNAAALKEIVQMRPQLAILVGRWSMWTRHAGSEFALTSDEVEGGGEKSAATSARVFRHMLARTVETLNAHGIKVLLLGQPPEFVPAPPKCVLEQERAGESSAICLSQSRGLAAEAIGPGNDALPEAVAPGTEASVFQLSDVFCRGDVCIAGDGERHYYSDTDHLSITGAGKLEKDARLRALITSLLAPGAEASAVPPR
ncbi:acyltransferase family protein [Xanthobacter sediminis]|uniref:acyltransferase family protein n=1 Tax=Xanthobacter sediminis TaxID=3119926 RepID=UPI003728E78C